MTLFYTLVDTYDLMFRVFMRLQGYLRPVRDGTTFFGAKMKCNVRDFIQRRIYFFQIYEPNLTYLFINALRPGDVVVDVGANIGYFSMLASKLVGPSGKVIAVEAAPETYALLRRNLDDNGCANVEALHLAATRTETTVDIARNDAANIGANAIREHGDAKPGEVRGRPLSAMLSGVMERVGFIKIDTEGSEAPILEDILAHTASFPRRLKIVAEISENSTHFIKKFREAGFQAAGLPNNYSIGYLFVRNYLRRSNESTFSVVCPVEDYSPQFRDYLFTRE
jgi:FkbM family methyltransferase